MGQLIDAVRAAVIKELYRNEKDGWTGDFCFTDSFIGFSGHFPGAPVLPAIVQILAAQVVAEAAAGKPVQLISVTRAKFHVQIRPGDHVTVSCKGGKARASGAVIQATIVARDQVAASFSMCFKDEGEE
jgi:3-hydroxyacyl-[acyl-carrier-protein] dehydratase